MAVPAAMMQDAVVTGPLRRAVRKKQDAAVNGTGRENVEETGIVTVTAARVITNPASNLVSIQDRSLIQDAAVAITDLRY